MKGMRRGRWVAAAAMVTAATLAFSARPALAAEADSSTWAYVGPSPMSCQLGSGTFGWTCQTSTAIVASGANCIEAIHVDGASGAVTLPAEGCTASLSIPSGGWQGIFNCNRGYPVGAGCQGALPEGTAILSFQPVVGASFNQEIATITDAACTSTGGHATVTLEGVDDNTNAFSMQSALDWVGSCSSVTELTWTGTFTVA